jgi:hypothetical protein
LPNSSSFVYFHEMDVPNSVSIPRRSTELLRQARRLFNVDFNEPIKRLLFEKVEKRINIPAFQLALVENERDNLKQLVARLRPVKRKKVVPDSNQAFIQIEQVIATRAIWGNTLDPQGTSSAVQLAEFEALCSKWQLERP